MKIQEKRFSKAQICFWLILFTSLVLRMVALAGIPTGVNQDEAMGAMDAWALSKYGTDRLGMQWPVHFTAWGYSHMSVLLSYTMIPFIKVLGFSTFAVRIPMVLASVMGIALVYLTARKFFDTEISLAIMAFAAINPWHFMQSRWSLDCNLFPHVFLLGFYLLLCGLEKKRYLYLSMVVFGLTFYCYGIAVYTVPVFLFVYAAWCLWQKQLKFKEVLISVCIFFAVALPEILVMFINMFKLDTIHTPWFTIPYFPDSVRSDDILFMNFSFYQLKQNCLSVLKQVFLQCPDHLFNALPAFGPMYHISTPFMLLGIWQFGRRFLREKDLHTKTIDLSLLGFLIMGLWAGVLTYEVNINRINIIFYPLMFMTVYGIVVFIRWIPKYAVYIRNGFIAAYSILAIMFLVQYFGSFGTEIRMMFNADFLEVIYKADALEQYDRLYVSSDMGWQTNAKMAEILTQYGCRIDAQYVQGQTQETGGRILLPYTERYHFINLGEEESFDKDALYVLSKEELSKWDASYEVVLQCGDFFAVDLD